MPFRLGALVLGLLVGLTAVSEVRAAGLQLKNLKDTPTADRFPLPTDLVWPAAIGDFDVCLWNDDKFAAVCITIDDNQAPDHAWWTQQLSQYGWNATWFVITGLIQPTPGFYGTWADFIALHDLGHDIHSHTVTHQSNDDIRPEAEVIAEYSNSLVSVEANIPGARCLTLAYPYGNGNRDIAADHYVANRGVVGGPNEANRIDYMNTKSNSGTISQAMLDAILYGINPWNGGSAPQLKRGWCSFHFHQAGSQTGDELANLKTFKQIWVGTFGEVTAYGQERDTIEVTVSSLSASAIEFSLSDDMDDTLFDVPLTVKFRVGNDWSAATATQNGASTTAWIVEHDGNRYALVKAVPDQGVVVLQQTDPESQGFLMTIH